MCTFRCSRSCSFCPQLVGLTVLLATAPHLAERSFERIGDFHRGFSDFDFPTDEQAKRSHAERGDFGAPVVKERAEPKEHIAQRADEAAPLGAWFGQ